MKTIKILLILCGFFICSFASNAQSPMISQFREILAEGPTNFVKLKGDFHKEVAGAKYYKTPIEGVIGSAWTIIKTDSTGKNNFLYVYEFEVNDETKEMVEKTKSMIMKVYLAELNQMIGTGKYKAEQYENGDDYVTRITNLEGKKVLDLIRNDNKDLVFIEFYSLK